jgi:amino acid transporter/nucleotide-binding universal stress UspA family protein
MDRDIGLVGAIALGVGTMIAAGIFVLSGLAVSNVGAMAIVSFLIAAVVASFTAFAYAEFSAIYPESGGGYAYVSNVFDTDLTYIVGWSMILGYPASAAFYLASFSDWFYRFIFPVLNIPQAIPYWVSGLVILGLLVGLNLKGTEETGVFQIVVTALKVALIVLFLYGGLQAFDSGVVADSFVENAGKFQQIGLTSALVFITFFGFEAIATNAEEIEKPGSNVPRAIFFSMGFVTVIYTFVVLVIVLAVHDPQFLSFLAEQAGLASPEAATEFVANNGEVSMGRAAQYYLGDFGFYVIIAGALFSMLSAANATILAGSRVKLAMSRRDHLPPAYEKLHPSLNTPYKAVLLTGGLIFLFIAVFTVAFGGVPGSEGGGHGGGGPLHLGIEALAHFADFMLLTGLIVVNFAVIRSRQKHPDLDRPFEVPAVPWVPIVAVLANLALLVNVEFTSLVLGLGAEAIGVALWFAIIGGGPPDEKLEEEAPTVVTEGHARKRDYQILVPIANPDHAEQMMRTAIDIARDNDGEVMLLSVVPLPDQTPLSEGEQYVPERREVLDSALSHADDEVPVAGTVRIAHHVDTAILHTIQQYGSDAVLMGWHATDHPRRDKVLGSIVDEVARRADCDVLVERIAEDGSADVDSILLPTAGGPNAAYAATIARAIARTNDAGVELLRCLGGGDDRQQAEALMDETAAELEDVEFTKTVVDADDVVDEIVDRSAGHDLTIIGATREGILQRLVFGDIPEEVGRRAHGTVIMAKKKLPVTSRIRKLFDRF